ncbi:MAG: hypothetical protein R3315_05315 [Woeseiaceae bacterium]|nr:hypothetical protein [Woeseiaceae bacterium]
MAWMVVTAYMLWLAVAPKVGCDGESAELLRLLLFAAPSAAGIAFLTSATRPMPEVHRILRWITVLPAILLPFALTAVWDVAQIVYFDALPACRPIEAGTAMQVWPAVQVLALIVCSFAFVRAWRAGSAA